MASSSCRVTASAASKRRIALVTGGAKRMGEAIALALAGRGWDVAVHYRRSRRDGLRVVSAIERLGRRAVALDADLADEAATARLVARAAAALGAPTCLVNNASLFEDDDAKRVSYGSLDAHMRVNVGAPLVLARALHDGLPKRATGVVINLLDQKLFNPNPDYLSYTLSKAALQSATTLLAQALAPRVRVVGVAPGLSLPSADQTRAEFARAHRATPLGRSSTPDDVGSAVCFVAEAGAITGTVLLVDGGQHLVPMERDVMFVTRS